MPRNDAAARLLAGLRAGLGAAAPVAALLLIPAGLAPGGAWIWPRGLAFVCAYGGASIAGNAMLALHRPANFQVRQQSVVAAPERRQPRIDAIGSAALIAYFLAWLAFIPLDVFWLKLARPPGAALSWVGGVLVVLGLALNQLAVWQNPFATPNLQDQGDTGQRVIDTGVYGLIRHPIYAGNLALVAGAALWLGSWAAFAGAAVMLAATVGRIAMEEAHLRKSLPGYADYARRVRGRIFPYVL